MSQSLFMQNDERKLAKDVNYGFAILREIENYKPGSETRTRLEALLVDQEAKANNNAALQIHWQTIEVN